MSDSPLRIVPNQSTESDPAGAPSPESTDQAELAALRNLLLEPEQQQLANLRERLNNPRVRAREVGRVLSESIRLRAEQDDSLTEALGPTIVTAFHHSVKKDPRPVADAISPLMGPAIRRYISMMLNGMVQSFDQALKYSLSWQGVKWRIEAMKAGKSFAEVVMLHTLVYRVEQVFLIHKATGLKLAHLSADAVRAQDADIVSGMMNAMQEAIKSFARDSFGSAEDDTIDTLDLGDREVWFESGPLALLAVVIRGKAPESLREEYFVPALEAIHIEMGETLQAFDGDDAPFELARPHLESCLHSQYEGRQDPARFQTPLYLRAGVALALVAALALGVLWWRDRHRWNQYLAELRATPGLIVTEEDSRFGRHTLAGLRDPLAPDPDRILRERTALDPRRVAARWEPYQSLAPALVERHARQLLDAPPSVELRVENGVLVARGVAPDAWIADARKFARAVPGVLRYDDSQLIGAEAQAIERHVLRFEEGGIFLTKGQEQDIADLLREIRQLDLSAAATGRVAFLEIVGHTDAEGTEATNQHLSDTRADHILAMLVSKGFRKDRLAARGAGSREPVQKGASDSDISVNRSVSLHVSLKPLGDRP